MMKKLALCGLLLATVSGCVPVNGANYAPITTGYAQPVYEQQGYAYGAQPQYYYPSTPAYYHHGYVPPQGYYRQPAYYPQEVRPLNKGEHFYNEYGQYCKLTHGRNVICK